MDIALIIVANNEDMLAVGAFGKLPKAISKQRQPWVGTQEKKMGWWMGGGKAV